MADCAPADAEGTRITFTSQERPDIVVTVGRQASVMSYARDAGVPGILGRCGGYATCGTCHLYALPTNESALPRTPEDEADLLAGMGHEVRPESRLSCQIEVTPGGASLAFHVPE